MPKPRPLRVFLCHASADKSAVRNIHRYLKQRGVAPWLDEIDLLPGQKWEIEIPKALLSSDVILVCLSKNSVTKEGYVQKEITYALDKAQEKPDETIFIIPAKLEDCDVPQRLSGYQWVALFRNDGYKRLMQSLKQRAADLGPDVTPLTEDTQRIKLVVNRNAHPPYTPSGDELGKAEEERIALAKVESDRKAKEDQDRITAQKVEEERIAREKAEEERIALAKVESDRKAKEDQDRIAARKIENDRVMREKADLERKAKAERERKRIQNFKPILSAGGIILALLVLFFIGKAMIKNLPASPAPTQTSEVSQTSEVLPTVTPTEAQIPRTDTPEPPTVTPTPGIGSFITSDNVVMMYVPAGTFSMGSDQNSDEQPIHPVDLSAYYIDKFEVTNAAYKRCVDAGQCTPPKDSSSYTHPAYYGNFDFNEYPVIYVDWNMAKTYCEWRGDRLPTEAEWEKAARGTDGRTYPWGENIGCDKANYQSSCVGDTTKVGSYPDGASPYGVYDMAGNVWEWVSDWYDSAYYKSSPSSNPLGPDTVQYRVLRGGSWLNDENHDRRSAVRGGDFPAVTLNYIGFRCSRSRP